MMSRMPESFRLCCAVLICCLLFSTHAVAQSTTSGAIGGGVADPLGNVVPNASVKIRSMETGQETTTTTNEVGRFRVVELQPGRYEVTVEVSGFSPFVSKDVIVEVGRLTELEIPLKIAGAATTVEVVGQASVVTTEQHDFTNNINQTSINELPINGRRWSNFALLTPGATPDGNFGLISFRGISGLLNNSTVDGGDNNQAFFSEERGRTRIGYVISQASVQEFQVNTSNFSAEYGRAAGGVVNAITKSGGNRFHGMGFYYIRDNALGATNPFTVLPTLVGGNAVSVPIKPEDRRHQFGGALGGPLVKDKAFFFFSYDQQKRNFPGVAAPGSPSFLNPITVAMPPSCASPGLSAGAALSCRGITQAQTDAGLAFLRGISGVVPRTGDQYILLPKVDWQMTSNHRFTASYNRLHWNSPAGIQTQPVVNRGVASFGDDFVRTDSLNLRLVSILTPRVTNEARFQWGRDNEFENSQPPGPGEPTTGVGGRPPDVCLACFSTGIEFGKPTFLERKAFPDEKRVQFANSTTFAFGRHVVKFGGEFNHVNDLQDNLRFEGGFYTYSNIQDFISDFSVPRACGGGTIPCYSSYQQAFGPTAFEFTTNDYSLFVQDDWHTTRRLTLSLGLRYEYEQLPSAQIPNTLVPATSIFPSDRNNFGPRVGFALDLTGNGKMSLRGGYGIYYGRIINSTILNAITNTGVAAAQNQFTLRPSTTCTVCPTYPNVLPAAPTGAGGSPPDIVAFQSGYQNPMIHQVDLILEREIFPNTVVSASYLGSFGRDLPIFVDTNLSPTTATITYQVVGGSFGGQSFTFPLYTSRPNPTNFSRITEIRSTVESNYHALVLQFNRRFSNGLQFQNNYTYSKATDNGQSSTAFTAGNNVLDPFNLALERGISNFDLRHRFVTSIVWSPELKGGNDLARAILNGFTISPIFSAASGRPFVPTISGSAPGGISTGVLGAGGTNRPPFLARNSFNFPPTHVLDLRISRRFRITEGSKLEVLAEAFNLYNHVNVTDLGTRLYTIGGTPAAPTLNVDTTFGQPIAAGNTLFRERQIQLAVRFQF